MLTNKLTPNQRLQRAVALEGIATAAEDMVNKGSSPLETQTFVQGAERELARELGDTQKMNEAAKVAKRFKDIAG